MSERSSQRTEPRLEPLVRSADELLGAPVVGPDGKRIGQLREIMLDAPTGRIVYGILSLSPSFEADRLFYPVPWPLLRPCSSGRELLLDVEPELLRSAPAFDPEEWPDMSDRRWSAEVHAHYDLPPYWA